MNKILNSTKRLVLFLILLVAASESRACNINISANITTICSGTQITFTGVTTVANYMITYQWEKNGVPMTGVGNSGSMGSNPPNTVPGDSTFLFTTDGFVNGDVVTCFITEPYASFTNTSNSITITVNPKPTITLGANPSGCTGITSASLPYSATSGSPTKYSIAWSSTSTSAGFANVTNATLPATPITLTVPAAAPANTYAGTLTVTNATTTCGSQAYPISVTTTSTTPSVNISGTTTICSGTSVTFTATPTNGGSSPSYQWKLNGVNVGTNSTTYTNNSLANTNTITCTMTSNASCASPASATSNTLTMTVNSNVTPSVSIAANPGTSICSGTSVTFTATATNGGSTPSYQWKLNGNNVGTNSATYSNSSLANNDVISVVMTSNAACASPATATSTVTMTVNSVTPSLVIAGTTTICSGTSVTFTATPTNGGAAPSYQWKVNGTNVGTNSTTYTSSSLNNNDLVTCTMTSNATCASPATAASNTLTMNVTTNVTPSVSIAANPGTSICSGTSVTFTATATNGGSTPSYQWKLNGNNVGTNSATYSNSSLANNDVVSVVMTSNATCASPATATSTVTMTVNSVTPSLVIAGTTTICSGTSVTFTATPTNGGAAPSYQWKVNGTNVGTNSTTYTSSSLNNNDLVTCTMTSNATCASPTTAASNTLTMTVNSNLTPSVSIAANPGTSICSGTSVTFTATATNGGSTPSYQWKLNSNNVGTNSATYSNSSLANNDVVSVVMTSNATCASPATATSTVTMTVNHVTPSLVIAGTTTICTGTSVTFTATPTNGGAAPSYQWKVNGTNVGTNSTTYTSSSLNNNDLVTCTMTSNATCASPTTAASNTLTMTVNSNLTPSVSIAANPGTSICSGTSVTFTATATNGGSTPSYQWKLNGNNVGTNSATYSNSSLANNDVVSVVMTSNATCASPATATSTVTMTVNNVTPSLLISGTTVICAGTSVTFTATPTNGGSSPSYQWKLNGVNVGTNSTTYTNNTLANTNTITCTMTSSATCASPATAASNTLTMTVNSNVTPSVSIAANPGTSICSGTSVTFTATATNGGSTPSYQWKLNGNNVGTNSATYSSSSLANNDVVSVVMTSNATCASPATATSTVTMTVNGVTPSVSISGNNTSCAGISVTFTATPTNGGSAPSYQWKVNGANVGTNSITYTSSSLNNGDVVSCVMTSNATCVSPTTATSNTITMTINSQTPEPGAFTVSSAITYQGQASVTYTVPSVVGLTYTWSYSGTGVTISGSGNSVTLSFGPTSTSGSLCVYATATVGCGPSPSRCIPITVKPYETWTCGSSTDWNVATNWDGGFVPYNTISVLIPSGVCTPNICTVNASVNNVTINSGATVTICCGHELDVKGNFTNNGSVTGCGYVVVTDSCHTLYGKGEVDNFELRSGCSVCNTVINSGDTLHIGKTYLPTSGTLVSNGGLELLSDSTGTAVILAHGNVCGSCNTYVSGEITCDKYIHGGVRAFRFLGHPFTSAIGLDQLTPYMDITGQGGSANGFTTTVTNNPSAFWYNTLLGNGSNTNDSTGWIPFTNTNGLGANAWNRFEGIRLFFRGSIGQGLGCTLCVPNPITIKMHGPINGCEETVTYATNSNVGYNFVGNPYPSNIDLSLCTRGSSIGANFAVWDPNQGTEGAYVSQPFNFSYILPSMSAFFTTCSANTNNTITFHESDKTASAATGNLFKTTSGFGSNSIQLHITSNNDSLSWDRLLLFFNGQAMANVDALDGQKMFNPGLSFYSYSADQSQLSIDVRPYVDGQVIKLGLQNASQMSYAIHVDDYDVPAGATLYLHDKYLNQVQALSLGMQYNFSVTSDANSQGDNRFELNLSGATSVANVIAGNEFKVNMIPNPATSNATVSFEAPQSGNTVVRVSAITGQVIYSTELGDVKSGKAVLPLQNFAPGIYIVNVVCGNYSTTQRLVKQ